MNWWFLIIGLASIAIGYFDVLHDGFVDGLLLGVGLLALGYGFFAKKG
ncbi:MAG: hypothetical protein AABY15_09555 [Nanoarchaeota archaeon]